MPDARAAATLLTHCYSQTSACGVCVLLGEELEMNEGAQ